MDEVSKEGVVLSLAMDGWFLSLRLRPLVVGIGLCSFSPIRYGKKL